MASDERPLRAYEEKRDFARTPEPPARGGRGGARPRFVVHKHAARRLHYDLRLEAGGVLKSWAVPRGPSMDPKVKRLAVRTEDHPLEYADFEGAIPGGQYGAGAVLVWDAGTYRNLTGRDDGEVPVEQAVEDGHVSVWLEGKKLTGGFALTRTGRDDGKERWILVKMRDAAADPGRDPVRDRPESVLSGRTIEEIAEGARRRSAV
jgi:DNA ligase D-like protein (predicted 3'-phosphoesterase)